MEALEKEQKECEIDMTSPNFFKAKMIAREQPAIEAVPVVYGELVYTNDDIPPHCSVCHTMIHADSNYCRECGARMEKERHE